MDTLPMSEFNDAPDEAKHLYTSLRNESNRSVNGRKWSKIIKWFIILQTLINVALGCAISFMLYQNLTDSHYQKITNQIQEMNTMTTEWHQSHTEALDSHQTHNQAKLDQSREHVAGFVNQSIAQLMKSFNERIASVESLGSQSINKLDTQINELPQNLTQLIDAKLDQVKKLTDIEFEKIHENLSSESIVWKQKLTDESEQINQTVTQVTNQLSAQLRTEWNDSLHRSLDPVRRKVSVFELKDELTRLTDTGRLKFGCLNETLIGMSEPGVQYVESHATYPSGNYTNNFDRRSLISVPNNGSSLIVVKFMKLDTERRYDWIKFYTSQNQTLIASYSGHFTEGGLPVLIGDDHDLWYEWHTDGSEVRSGWKFKYFSLKTDTIQSWIHD